MIYLQQTFLVKFENMHCFEISPYKLIISNWLINSPMHFLTLIQLKFSISDRGIFVPNYASGFICFSLHWLLLTWTHVVCSVVSVRTLNTDMCIWRIEPLFISYPLSWTFPFSPGLLDWQAFFRDVPLRPCFVKNNRILWLI